MENAVPIVDWPKRRDNTEMTVKDMEKEMVKKWKRENVKGKKGKEEII